MAGRLIIEVAQPALDSNANLINGSTLEFYDAVTLAPKSVYSDSTLATSLGNVVTASGGFFPDLWGDNGHAYRVIWKNAAGSVLRTMQRIEVMTSWPAAPGYIPDYVSAKRIGMVGNNTGDQSSLLQTLLNDGRRVVIEAPASAYRLTNPVTITQPVVVEAEGNGNRPLFTLGMADHAFKIRSSNVSISGLRFTSETGTKQLADRAVFLFDTAASAATLREITLRDLRLGWTGGICHDNGGTGAFERVYIRDVIAELQRGRGIKWTRGFASLFFEDCFFDRLRSGGALYGGETLAELNYPMFELDTPSGIPGAGGTFFDGVRSGGSTVTGATNDHGWVIGSSLVGGGGYRWSSSDADAHVHGVVATFLDELEFHDSRFSAMYGHGIVLDRVTDVIGEGMRFDGRDLANMQAVRLIGTNNKRIRISGHSTRYQQTALVSGAGHEDIDLQAYLSPLSTGTNIAPFLPTTWSQNDPNGSTAPVTGLLASSGGTTAGNGVFGRVGFGAPSFIADETLVSHIARLTILNTTATSPYVEFDLGQAYGYGTNAVTVDMWYRENSGGSYNVTPSLIMNYGTGGSPSATVTTTGETFLASSTWRRFSWTIPCPSHSGKTFGTNNDSSLRVRFALPSATILTFDIAKPSIWLGGRTGVIPFASMPGLP